MMRVVDYMKELRKSKEKERDAIQQDIEDIDAMLAFHEGRAPSTMAATPKSIREGAIEILAQSTVPMHRKQIYVQLLDMGMVINGKDPTAGLGSVLSRCSKDFVPHGQGIWGLKIWQSVNGHEPQETNGLDRRDKGVTTSPAHPVEHHQDA